MAATHRPWLVAMTSPKTLILCAALAAAALVPAAPRARADEPVRVRTGDAVLDRNGDGFQDVVVAGRAVHHDIDFDGRFDFTLALAFKEYTGEGHRRYLGSGFAPEVYADLTRKGLDNLCASERVAANWTAEHFREFPYYHDGYGQLRIFDGSPENDGRLAGDSPRPRYEYTVVFNPDGSVASVQRGDRTISLAAFDYEKNVSSGIRLILPGIARPADLEGIRAELGQLFESAPGGK
jgi:hypothetical protein